MSQQSIYSNSQNIATSRLRLRSLRRRSTLILFSVALLILGLIPLLDMNNNPVASLPTRKVAATTTVPSDAGGSPKAVSTSANKPVTNVAVSPTPNCRRTLDTTHPIAPLLNSDSSGLVQSPLITADYEVFGASVSEIRGQINSCSPIAHEGTSYAASAEYAISWAFQYQADGAGNCTIKNASVGLSTVKTMPKWQATRQTPAALRSQWNTFITNLHTHENEHLNIDKKYAEKILFELQNYPPTSCETLNTSANARSNAIVAELNSANDRYDAATKHGLTQGALL